MPHDPRPNGIRIHKATEYILNGSLEKPRQNFRGGKSLNILLSSLRLLQLNATCVIAETGRRIMTTLPAKHDAFGGGDLQDGMGASSPFELIDRKEEEIERVREFADITKHSQQQNHLSLSQVKTTEDSSDDSDEQNHGESGGPPKHAGFWDHSMVNVRMHVIKLWARDGKSEFHYHQSAKNPRGWGGGGKGEYSNYIFLSPF